MKTETKPKKNLSNNGSPKSKLKAAYGKYKEVIVETADCWDDDLEKTISVI